MKKLMSDCDGMLKVFLSSTFKDIRGMREGILNRLNSSLIATGMEKFRSKGDLPQEISLKELEESDIIIFLISPYYGTEITECKFKNKCEADCGMKTGKERISHTWCEFRYTKAGKKLHSTYILDEGWKIISRDGAPKIWRFKEEVEKESCSRIKNNNEGIEKVLNDLALNIINWYSERKLNFKNFCDRRTILKEIFYNMHKTVEITGIGGVGKTTLCEVLLLIYKLLGKRIFYVGHEEGYASGTGYIYASQKLSPYRVPKLTIDAIIEALNLKNVPGAKEEKVKNILQKLERDDAILYIDNFRENKTLEYLIKRANSLKRGCILFTAKKEFGIGGYRRKIEGIKRERRELIEIMASRMGKKIKNTEAEKIEEITEGHPIATYILISNMGRVDIKSMGNFKIGLDFSRERDVEEYMERVIKSSMSSDAYNLLKEISIIEEKIDIASIYSAISEIKTYSKELLEEIIDVSIIERINNKFLWKYNHIREALVEDKPEMHKLAVKYFQKKIEIYDKDEDEIDKLYHMTKLSYERDIFELFKIMSLSIEIKGVSELIKFARLAEEIGKSLKREEDKAIIYLKLGEIYLNLANYRDIAENCKKAIKTFEKALETYIKSDFLEHYAVIQEGIGNAYSILAHVEDTVKNCKKSIKSFENAMKICKYKNFPTDHYAELQNNIGSTYLTLADVENKEKNCKRAIKAFENVLTIFTFEDYPAQYAVTQNNLGNAYTVLAEIRKRKENCKRAIKARKQALKIFNPEDYPMEYSITQHNLGSTYLTLADVENKEKNCKRAIKACEKALKIFTFEDYPAKYAGIQNSLGNVYGKLAEVNNGLENCKKAIKAFEKTLKVYNIKEFPIQYAMTQNNLGGAYLNLSEIKNTRENCKNTIDAYKEALKVYTLEDFPMDYAMTQSNLGNAYIALAEIRKRKENCKKAIKACEEALKIFTFKDYPIRYVEIQSNLGLAYGKLAEAENKEENCKKAIKAFENIFKLGIYKRSSRNYAMIKNNLGVIYLILADEVNKEENCKKAIKAFEEFFKVDISEKYPIDHAGIESNLGLAYGKLAEAENKEENCKKAIKACEEALKVFTFEDYPVQYAVTQNNLGNAYLEFAEIKNTRENCKNATEAFEEALKVLDPEDYPIEYAMTRGNLGSTYKKLAEVENKEENCKKAIKACEEALKIFTFENLPEKQTEIKENLKNIFLFCNEKK